jgi:uncharacterized protein YkwD
VGTATDTRRVPRPNLALTLLTSAAILACTSASAVASTGAPYIRGTCQPQRLRSAHRLSLLCRPGVGTSAQAAARHTARPLSSAELLSAASAARATTIAKVLAAPCLNTQLVPEAANLPLIRAAVLCLVNRERAQNGEAPLILNSQLEKAAEGHNQEMIAEDYFAHVSPAGETPVQRIQSTTDYLPGPKVGYVIGENLAWGTLYLATPQAIVEAWIASPGHLANILESRYRETGVGVVASVPSAMSGGQSGATYAQEFGVIVH